jgi:uncharacterized protein YcaQ
MPNAVRTISPTTVRRMAVARQRLAGPSLLGAPGSGPEGAMEVIRGLRYVQLDPISVVARSPLLILWSRLGRGFQPAHLDHLLWDEHSLFEYWAYRASIVLTQDFPIFHWVMRGYPTPRYSHGRRTIEWLAHNQALRRHVLRRLRSDGPLRSRDIEDLSAKEWRSGGWTTGRNVERMIDVLWTQGRVLVTRRDGLTKWWDVSERVLPAWTPRGRLSEPQVVHRASQLSLRGLGVARSRDIRRAFTHDRYPGLDTILPKLERQGLIERVRVADDGVEWPGPWFVHSEDLPLLERLDAGEWEPRTTLLSPFDNLIIDRERSELLFGFRFRMEIYVPKDLRVHGYYALPVLHGDRVIGKIDASMDRKSGRFTIKAVHAEPPARPTRVTGRAVAGAVQELAAGLGASEIVFAGEVPAPWAKDLR